jgi:methyl-accepting chemotaxis protein-1 (serine sensor receptor)
MKLTGLQFKFLLIVTGSLAVAMAVTLFSLFKVFGSIEELDRISREDFDTQETIMQATADFKLQVQEWKNVLLRGRDPAVLDKHWAAFEAAESAVTKGVHLARTGTPHREVRERLEKFSAEHKEAGAAYRRGLEAFRASRGDPYAGDRAVAGVDRKPTATIVDAFKSARDLASDAEARAVRSAESAYKFAIAMTILVIVLVVLVVWYFVRRAVLHPIEVAVGHAERIARGDLTVEIHSASKDETGKLLRSLALMRNGLADVVVRVRNSAESVVTAARQVAMGTTDLSQRTEEQASSLEETAASMEELASTVKQNADNARQADELARSAWQRAEQGGAEVVRVVVTMSEISDSARKISDIISVIDGIAFQTNILALNAAVEAARAGEQGRGFAVVASEVRALAQRSAQAAKEIKDLIANSAEKVNSGTRLVEQAGDTIQALVVDVKRVSDLMRSIAEASAEQSRGVQQVNRTVTEMDKVVQQNASVVQESTAAAESMRQQAGALVQAVSTFRIGKDAGESVAYGRLDEEDKPALVAQSRERQVVSAAKTPVAALPAADDDWEQF